MSNIDKRAFTMTKELATLMGERFSMNPVSCKLLNEAWKKEFPDEVAIAERMLALLDELEAKDKSISFLKDQLAQLANFNPDWDKLEASYESWSEIAAELLVAKDRIAELEQFLHIKPCQKCNDTGVADSGGTQPWGEPISIPCDCTAPPAPVSVPDEVSWEDVPEEITEDDMALASAWAHGFNQCRAAMLQGADGNSQWVACSERMPDENAEQEVLACFKGGDISTLYYFEGRWDDAYGIVPIRQDVTHWMPMPAAPQQE